jgi:hypothetical protein
MLHCNMDTTAVQLRLDDLLADLRHARRSNDLGRLALVAYCEVRRWARSAGEPVLANRVAQLVLDSPQPSREAFLAEVDALIGTLEQLQRSRSH